MSIVVGVDGTPGSSAAIRLAREEAGSPGRVLVVPEAGKAR